MHLASRDLSLLGFLDRTPATAAQILRASVSFGDEPFRDERRARERLQTFCRERLLRRFSLAVTGGGLANYYKLTPEGYRTLHGDAPLPHRSYFAELSLSRLSHTLDLAEAITHIFVTAHQSRVGVSDFHRENELVLETGPHRVAPDCHVQLSAGGRIFNVLFELDRSTETLDGIAASSIRNKLLAYEAYQDYVWAIWKRNGERGQRPYFRVAFLTVSVERAHHILSLAGGCARNRERRLIYAASFEEYLAATDAIRAPIFLDHHGGWQALVNTYPTSPFTRARVRIVPFTQPSLPLS